MSTLEYFTNSDELKKVMSAARATITAPFFGNNVEEVKSVSEAYKLAKDSSGTVELTFDLFLKIISVYNIKGMSVLFILTLSYKIIKLLNLKAT